MSTNDKNKPGLIIPFGKYKGQPIEVLANDPEYRDFISAQPWFREKFANFYSVIINNFGDPSETPEHNALQARFLDEDFRLKFASVAFPRLWWLAQASGEMVNALANWLATQQAKIHIQSVSVIQLGQGSFRAKTESWELVDISLPVFEENGVDVSFAVQAGISIVSYESRGNPFKGAPFTSKDAVLNIEIKPEIGDDYPAVLRQMRRNKSTYLFTRRYVGAGVGESTFIEFMESQDIRVIFENEVDAAPRFAIETFKTAVFLDLVKRKIDEKTASKSPCSPSKPLDDELI